MRFIRLKFACEGWNDGLTEATGAADRNFLRWYKANPAVKFRVAEVGEFRAITQLKHFEQGHEPPFVYLTGEGKGKVSKEETAILKRYLKNGGMLIVDAGSRTFHEWFVTWVRNLTQNRGLVRVPEDDVIFKGAYRLDGIDALHNHAGQDEAFAMGSKMDGRWAIFYHPGDMNDCWKDNADGIPRRIRENARFLMFNLIYHAIVNYREASQEHYQP